MTDYRELKRLAEAANGWTDNRDWFAFTAAANPAAVLELIAENERLKVDNVSMRGSTKRMGEDTSKMQRQLRKLQRECDQLKAENEALRGSLASAEGVLEGDLASTYRDLVNGRDVGGELYEDIQRLRAALGVQA